MHNVPTLQDITMTGNIHKNHGKKIQKLKLGSVFLLIRDHVLFQRHHHRRDPKDHQISKQHRFGEVSFK